MKKIAAEVAARGNLCAEIMSPPSAMIVFGASGDLAHTKLFPGIFQIFRRGLLADEFYIIGCGRTKFTDEDFRKSVAESLETEKQEQLDDFLTRFYFISGDYKEEKLYSGIKKKIGELDEKYGVKGNHIFYLSVPPFLYTDVVEKLGSSRLSCVADKTKLVIEKPFGRDLNSAMELDATIHKCFDENQIYRIDHYLGKETVQNILMFRFANAIFEPVWNLNYIDHVQITIAEETGVGKRGSYYDRTGALRDIFQNHMLQMVSLVAMEPPVSFDADSVRDEKIKVFKAIRQFDSEYVRENFVRGQYGRSKVDDTVYNGYHDEDNVDKNSLTETFVAAKILIDNWRWRGVPFYLRTGKRLSSKKTEIVIVFKEVPHSMFRSAGIDGLPPNILIMKIQPEEGVSLRFQAKGPGAKVCMSTLNMEFKYREVFGQELPEAYQRLLLDCMLGDQTLFMRYDNLEIAWKLMMPILATWEKDKNKPDVYASRAQSFTAADELMNRDRRKWNPIVK